MNQPFVSIIINNYNYGAYLGDAIDSALSQTYSPREVVVVDDGSTDNSQEVIASYRDRIVPVLKENGGQASAFNAGFARSKGEIICFLDSDDIFVPAKVTEVVKAFTLHQDIGWCFHPLPQINSLELENKKLAQFSKIKQKNIIDKIDFRSDIKNAKLPNFVPATSALCFSRFLLEQILPMPEDEGVCLGDFYVTQTAVSLSKGCHLSSPLAIQRVHANNVYTRTNVIERREVKAKIRIITSYWMKEKFPVLSKLTNKLFAKGLATYLRNQDVDAKYRKIIKDYLLSVSPLEISKIISSTLYYYVKLFVVKEV
jgi:glycosyltransferase involved in cell wall biosynthesis